MDGRVYRICLVRPVGKFVPKSWNDWPEHGVIMRTGRRLVSRVFAENYAYTRNSRLREAGKTACFVVIRPGQRARTGEYCERGVPLYDVA